MTRRGNLRNKLKNFLKRNTDKKKVIVISSYDKVSLIARELRRSLTSSRGDVHLLCFKSRIPEELNDFAGITKLSEDYLVHDDYVRIDAHVFRDASVNWHKKLKESHKDVFTYRDIELTKMAEYELQLFLIGKIKALCVIKEAVKKESYEAILVVDSNKELTHFDVLFRNVFKTECDFVDISDSKKFYHVIKKKLGLHLSRFLDACLILLPPKKGKLKLIDARLFCELGIKDTDQFTPVPFQKGVRSQLKCFLKNRGYLSFDANERGAKGKKIDPELVKDSFVFDGISYWELVREKIGQIIYRDFDRFRSYIDTFLGTHERNTIKSIILRNDLRELEKSMVLLARKLKIPTLVIQNGLLVDPNGHDTIHTDKVALWGKYTARWYEKLGNDPDSMVVVGDPFLDTLFSRRSKDSDTAKKEVLTKNLKFKENNSLVTLIGPGIGMFKLSSFTTDDIAGCMIRQVIKTIESIEGVNLVIKMHPNERAKTYEGFVKGKNRKRIAIVDKVDLHTLIEASDLIITRESTVGLDAVILNKPLAVISFGKRQNLAPYVDYNVAIAAYKEEDVESVIKKGLYDTGVRSNMSIARENFVKDLLYKTDGKSTERVKQLIDAL